MIRLRETLFIAATHGDETIGVEALQEVSSTQSIQWIIGNELAYRARTREFEGNLNRVAPGQMGDSQYAVRRAAEIMQIARSYRFVIDIHGTDQSTGIFIIVSSVTRANFELALTLPIDRIVLWPAPVTEHTGALNAFVACGVEIECGDQRVRQTRHDLVRILKTYSNSTPIARNIEAREVYYVDGRIEHGMGIDRDQLSEFQEVCHNNDRFIPLLIGVYPSIVCYRMRRLTLREIDQRCND